MVDCPRAARPLEPIWCLFRLNPQLRTDSSRNRQNFADASEIVGSRGEHEEPFDQLAPAVSCLAHDPYRLHPAKRFLDPFAFALADLVTAMAGGARIDRRATSRIVLGDMRHAALFAAAGDEVGGVVVLVVVERAA